MLALSQTQAAPARLALFIDSENFTATFRALNIQIDYRKLRSYFSRYGDVIAARYYASVPANAYTPMKPLLDWLRYNEFTVVEKSSPEHVGPKGRILRRSIAVDLACDVLDAASHVDKIILCSGDGRYQALVRSVQQRGAQVWAVSSRQCSPPMMADVLRRQVDDFIELADILPDIALAQS